MTKKAFFTFFSSYTKQFCFLSAHMSALALKCSIMFKCHKLKKRKHLPAFEYKLRETLNRQSQMILFFLQITITLLYDSNKNSLRLFIAHCNISASSLSLECNCMLRTTCLLADPLPNVTLILNDNADVTLPVCETCKGQLNIYRSQWFSHDLGSSSSYKGTCKEIYAIRSLISHTIEWQPLKKWRGELWIWNASVNKIR